MRKILHIDMDCFYAAIECRDDPAIRGRPVGVGGGGQRGVLSTCNYEARKYGCRSAMPLFKALELCPQLIVKPPRFEVYRRESRRIRGIFSRYTPHIEPLSLDEAFLEVTHQRRYAWEIAREIRQSIRRETGLTASAGVAPNKMLAKIASDWRKPDGQFAVLPDEVEAFMKDLPLRRIPGIGPRAESLFQEQGIRTCGDLQDVPFPDLVRLVGAARAEEMHDRCRGKDDRPVEQSRVRKSLSVERTYPRDMESVEACLDRLDSLLDELEKDYAKLRKPHSFTKVFVKCKFADFRQTTCEQAGSRMERELFEPLLRRAFERNPHAVRLLGVGVRFPEGGEDAQLEFPFKEPVEVPGARGASKDPSTGDASA
ncbi:MAG: DNA polymerase IV [Verrucomicrobia bacterium]|jgi:DNA polymerase-4|nr:DNA polymerase IV [Verrucomicrobiota bacterium]